MDQDILNAILAAFTRGMADGLDQPENEETAKLTLADAFLTRAYQEGVSLGQNFARKFRKKRKAKRKGDK